MPTQSICFNEVTLNPINHSNQLWIRSAELARALGYSDDRKVSALYSRHSDEFSNDMTVVLNLGTTDTPAKIRLFSPRGCHLIAMFARTPVAKAFRKWVLDVLDKMTVQVALPVAKAKKPAQKALPAVADPISAHAMKAQAAMDEVKALCSEFIASVFRLQSAIRRPVRTVGAVSQLTMSLERNLPVFGTAIGMNVSALSELLDVYASTLSKAPNNRCS